MLDMESSVPAQGIRAAGRSTTVPAPGGRTTDGLPSQGEALQGGMAAHTAGSSHRSSSGRAADKAGGGPGPAPTNADETLSLRTARTERRRRGPGRRRFHTAALKHGARSCLRVPPERRRGTMPERRPRTRRAASR
jgi:hypothetical protein